MRKSNFSSVLCLLFLGYIENSITIVSVSQAFCHIFKKYLLLSSREESSSLLLVVVVVLVVFPILYHIHFKSYGEGNSTFDIQTSNGDIPTFQNIYKNVIVLRSEGNQLCDTSIKKKRRDMIEIEHALASARVRKLRQQYLQQCFPASHLPCLPLPRDSYVSLTTPPSLLSHSAMGDMSILRTTAFCIFTPKTIFSSFTFYSLHYGKKDFSSF